MRIYSMTATFGKLRHETLTLEPGLNVIEAPNEWGKSTWCAFLLAMLYGLDTRAKSTKTYLAPKDRYAPWSGEPMSGRIDLCWQGRDITIQRATRGRVPMGSFEAFETATGLPVPELNAANCGQQLLGVERSVFCRAGFLSLNQMAVTADEALARRLQALVTTGDESGDARHLEQELKALRNRIRYNRTGLLSQTQEQLETVEEKLLALSEMEEQSRKQRERLGVVKERIQALQNHQLALQYAQAEVDARRVAQARDTMDLAERRLEALSQSCASLPEGEQAREKLKALERFCSQRDSLQGLRLQLEAEEPEPQLPEPFRDMSLEEAFSEMRSDAKRYEALGTTGPWLVYLVLAAMMVITGGILAWQKLWLFCAGSALLAVLFLILGLWKRRSRSRRRQELTEKYGKTGFARWEGILRQYELDHRRWSQNRSRGTQAKGKLAQQFAQLELQRRSLCGSQEPEKVMEVWQQVLSRRQALEEAEKEARRARELYESLSAMARQVQPPAREDHLNHSAAETQALLEENRQLQQKLTERVSLLRGRMESMGDPKELEAERDRLRAKVQKLEGTYDAVSLALETLEQAKQALQRRFAPQIVRQAQSWMEKMTGGRYDRLSLDAQLSIRAAAGEEDTLSDALWRSDGTVDQLYLALRLAVAAAVTPECPMVLDDALVRFDDRRLLAALEILRELGEEKQILLFTCQNREKRLLETL